MTGLAVDPARFVQIRDGEQRAFLEERQAEQQETEALKEQLPRLDAEIASLKQQGDLEPRQRELNQQLIATMSSWPSPASHESRPTSRSNARRRASKAISRVSNPKR
jgi:hypothetical protein